MRSILLKQLSIILPILLLGSFLFYWYQIRPAQIRSACDTVAWNELTKNSKATAKSNSLLDAVGEAYYGHQTSLTNQEQMAKNKSFMQFYDWKYDQCLHSKGLK